MENNFTEYDLNEFDRLTAMESSPNQMDRIRSRLEWGKWSQQFTKEQLDSMKEELVKRGRW